MSLGNSSTLLVGRWRPGIVQLGNRRYFRYETLTNDDFYDEIDGFYVRPTHPWMDAQRGKIEIHIALKYGDVLDS